MNSIDATCGICFLGYNDKERRPLVLPCSHTFCQACLEKLSAEDKKKCPNCREAWINSEVKDLLCCHQLIPIGWQDQGKDSDQCQEHRQEITTWCKISNVPICLKCLRVKHKTCDWVLMEEKYEEMVAKLNKLVTENGETFKSLDGFTKQLQNCCDKLADWQSKAEKELGNPLPVGKECGTAATVTAGKVHQKTLALVEMERVEPTNQFTRLLLLLSKAYQETLDGKPETFIKNFNAGEADLSFKTKAVPFEFSFGLDAENSSTISTTNSTTAVDGSSASGAAKSHLLMGDSKSNADLGFDITFSTTDLTFVTGGKWTIRNDAEVAAACQVLEDPLAKPSEVSIVVCDVASEERFDELLSLIAKRTCSVSLKSLYSHWKCPPEAVITHRTQSLSKSRIRSLLKPTKPYNLPSRCSLVEFWGFLDVDCVKLLPKTLKSIGLVLAFEGDMDILKELIRVDYRKWFWDNKWTCLNTLDIAVSKTFRPEWWNMHQTNKDYRGLFAIPLVPDLSKSRTVLKLALHFPRLVTEQDLEWMNLMLVKIKDSHMEIGSLTDVFLPGLLISRTKVYDVLKSCGLDTDLSLLTVHMPIDAKNIFSLQTKTEMGNCTFVWDLAKL